MIGSFSTPVKPVPTPPLCSADSCSVVRIVTRVPAGTTSDGAGAAAGPLVTGPVGSGAAMGACGVEVAPTTAGAVPGAAATGAADEPCATATTVAPTGIGCPGGITWVAPLGRVTVVVPAAGAELLWQPESNPVQRVAARARREIWLNIKTPWDARGSHRREAGRLLGRCRQSR